MYSHPIDQCPLEKTNLVTLFNRNSSYDTYACSRCGMKGKRHGVSNTVELETRPKCTDKPRGQVRLLLDLPSFGLLKGEVRQQVDSPEVRFKDDVWVYSPTRREPVRLLSREYESVLVDPPKSET